MHWQRVLSALLLVPPFLLLVQLGSPLHFGLLISLAVALVAWEFSRLCPVGTDGLSSTLTVLGALAWHAALATGTAAPGVVALLAGTALVRAVLGREAFREGVLRAGWVLLGAAYGGGLLGCATLVRALPDGRGLVYYVTAVTWAADTAAFYVGSRLGRTLLAPRVSPGKTVEGAVGGLLAALLVGVAGSGWAWPVSAGTAAAASLALAAVGILGDLAESAVKRAAGVKDSGGLIPGHGGVLDRLDSLVFATPLLYGLAWLGWL
jgi:phosphatidate cytidylyltransferase